MAAVPRERHATRLETFVDAAFAFALTMLVISVDAIPHSFEELLEALKRVPAFAASFAIIVMFWLGHYRWSRRYGIEDNASVALSLALVFLTLVFLYPLRLMMSGAFNSLTGGWLPSEIRITRIAHLQLLFVLYGLAFMLMSGTLLGLYRRVRRIRLRPPLSAVDRAVADTEVQAWAILGGVGGLSAALALLLPPRLIGASAWLYATLALVMPLMGRRWNRHIARAEAEAATEE
jgi:uncharacterized membrane protein